MQQDLNPGTDRPTRSGRSVVEPVAAPPAERVIDPAYVAQLEAAYRQQQGELNRLAPLADDINWMLEDESRVEGVRRYKNAYTEAAKPQYDPSVEPVIDYIDKKLAPVNEWVDTQRKSAERREQETRQSFINDNITYAQRLVAEKKSGRSESTSSRPTPMRSRSAGKRTSPSRKPSRTCSPLAACRPKRQQPRSYARRKARSACPAPHKPTANVGSLTSTARSQTRSSKRNGARKPCRTIQARIHSVIHSKL